jgi:conjugal transfer pilin signal peptidase TrbI
LLQRFDRESFLARWTAHGRFCTLACLLSIGAALLFQTAYGFGLNASPSLPQTLFLIHKGELPQRGQFVAFRWPGGGPYPAGIPFIKRVVGIAGDSVTRKDREFFVNGQPVGQAKTASRLGLPLAAGPTGVLPTGRYYVQAPHPDSLDSRYQLSGWIADSQIIGRADALF